MSENIIRNDIVNNYINIETILKTLMELMQRIQDISQHFLDFDQMHEELDNDKERREIISRHPSIFFGDDFKYKSSTEDDAFSKKLDVSIKSTWSQYQYSTAELLANLFI